MLMPEMSPSPQDNPPADSAHVGSVLQTDDESAVEESFTYPCPRCPTVVPDFRQMLCFNESFTMDVYVYRQITLIQSVRQLEDLWSQGSEYFRLYRPLNSIPTIGDGAIKRISNIKLSNTSKKVKVAYLCDCALKNEKPRYVLKTIESTVTGWKNFYHEIRQLLCMPPHPNIIGPPAALVYAQGPDTFKLMSGPERLPIVGFLMPAIDGKTLRESLGSSGGPYPTAKWCRQLTDALVHILDHGNGPDRPGYYSDLKPDNVMITSQGKDVVLIDFESGGNWSEYNPGEIEEAKRLYKSVNYGDCRECRGLGMTHAQYHRAGYDGGKDPTQSTEVPMPHLMALAHLDQCETHWARTTLNPMRRYNTTKFRYDNAPFGHLDPWTTMSREARENAMLFSLGVVCIGICRQSGKPPYRGDYPGSPPAGVPLEYWSILARMLSPDPKQRGSLKVALQAFKDWEGEGKKHHRSCTEEGR